MTERHLPGVAVAVLRDGRVLALRSYGHASLEHRAPVRASTVFEIASLTKPFTATAIMLLVRDGRIQLEDKIGGSLSDLPASWKSVTVRQLLTHTSGIPNFSELEDFDRRWRIDAPPSEVIQSVSSLPLDFEPGTRYHYSNTGYFLLGLLVEKASGIPYGRFLATRVFAAAGMHESQLNLPGAVVAGHASGYEWDQGEYQRAVYASPAWSFAAGGILSSIRDLSRWEQALVAGTVLQRSTLDSMWVPRRLPDGSSTSYGFGWGVQDYYGHRLIQHAGTRPGFQSAMCRFVDDHVTVVVLANRSGSLTARLAREIAAFYAPALARSVAMARTDRDPHRTARLRSVLEDLASGRARPEAFTERARSKLFPNAAREIQAYLTSLGRLRSFELFQEKPAGANTAIAYSAGFAEASILVQFEVTESGSIDAVNIVPE